MSIEKLGIHITFTLLTLYLNLYEERNNNNTNYNVKSTFDKKKMCLDIKFHPKLGRQ